VHSAWGEVREATGEGLLLKSRTNQILAGGYLRSRQMVFSFGLDAAFWFSGFLGRWILNQAVKDDGSGFFRSWIRGFRVDKGTGYSDSGL